MKKLAVVLFNLGGPLKIQDVKPFLFNLFYDRAIINLPNPFRWFLAWFISTIRHKKSQKIYQILGGGSPLLKFTKDQAEALENALGRRFKVFVCMRYWHPFSDEVIKRVEKYNPDEIILLPLYPQFSTTTTASSLKDFHEKISTSGISSKKVHVVDDFFDNKKFIGAHVSLLKDQLKKINDHEKVAVLFSAHGLPMSVIEAGDPYERQVNETIRLITKQISRKNTRFVVCYQSKVGLKKWLSPSTEEEITEAGKRYEVVVVVPISFVSEHSETLVELDQDYRVFATKIGCKSYKRVKALGTNKIFIDCLKDMCLELSGF